MYEWFEYFMEHNLVGIITLVVMAILFFVVLFFVGSTSEKKRKQENTRLLLEETENQEATDEVTATTVPSTPCVQKIEPASTDVLLEEVVESEENHPPLQNPSQMEPIREIKYVDEQLESTRAQEELAYLTQELAQAYEEEKKTPEIVVSDKEDHHLIEHTDFEQEQEEKAIISLEELMQKGDTLYETNAEVQYQDEGDEPINLQELEARYREQLSLKMVEEEQPQVTLESFNVVEEAPVPYKFKNSPFISPVFGLEEERPLESKIELENTADYGKLDDEIRKTSDFVDRLKELQQKLD